MREIYEVRQGECASDSPTMIRVIRICRKCGAKIFSDAPEGLCTGCVLEAALGMSPVAGVYSSAVAAYSAEAAAKAGLAKAGNS